MKKILVSLVAMMFLFVPMAFGLSIEDATANGVFADEIANDFAESYTITGIDTELAFVNSLWAPDNFFTVGKFDFDDNETQDLLSGWNITVTPGDVDVEINGETYTYGFAYTVTAPANWVGSDVDFVLGVKQPTTTGQVPGPTYYAYLFEAVTLNIDDGTFNSYGPRGGNAYSHITAFVRGSQEVPEPSTLLLFGAGIAGLALYRRKRS